MSKGDKIGSLISIITKAESRYEGTLAEVDRVNKTMKLCNVRSMGTEGRRNGEKELPSSDAVTGAVKFRVDLIKSIKILEEAAEEEEEEEEEEDPAIVECQEEQETPAEPKKKPEPSEKAVATAASEKAPKRKLEKYSVDAPDEEEGEAAAGGDEDLGDVRGAHRHRGGMQNNQRGGADADKPKYDKSADFFDSISNSTLEVRPQRGGRGGRGGEGRGNYRGDRGGYRGGGGYGDYQTQEYRGNYRGGRGGGGDRRPQTEGDGGYRGGWTRNTNNYRGGGGGSGFGDGE